MASLVALFTSLFQGLNISITVEFAPKSVGVFITALTTLLSSFNVNNDIKLRPNVETATPSAYDFIIVGSGSAGGIIANRLSENGAYQVLLLEAGGDPTQLNEIPNLTPLNLGHPETDWMYKIVPQTNSCLALVDNRMTWYSGKSLGGSTNLNFMAHMRGNPKDFDHWAELTQDSQWNYSNVLPFFKKAENYHGNFPNDQIHGTGGPVWVSSAGYQPLADEWINSAKGLGYPVQDLSANQTSEAFSSLEFNIKDGKRVEVYEGYIQPALNRSNLHIARYAHVTKINLDSDKKATGVEYTRHGKKMKVTASKEVIISAGAIGSPKLLMLSGIGPKEHLRSVGIEPIVDLPGVGQDLTDHVGVIVGPFLLNDSVSFIPDRDLSRRSVTEYLTNHTGVFASTIISGVGMISTTNTSDWPNIGILQFPIGIGKDGASSVEQRKQVKSGVMQKYYEGFIGKDAVTVAVFMERPLSRGSITLKSGDALEPPIIDPKYFNNPKDLEAMVAATKFIVKMYEKKETWQKLNATLIPNHFPGCDNYTLRTDAYYECFIRHFTGSNWHFASTCKMGRTEDPMAVVDSQLKVKGISNLRVADASVMPQIPSAPLNAPTMMIGEKAAELILKTWATPNLFNW